MVLMAKRLKNLCVIKDSFRKLKIKLKCQNRIFIILILVQTNVIS